MTNDEMSWARRESPSLPFRHSSFGNSSSGNSFSSLFVIGQSSFVIHVSVVQPRTDARPVDRRMAPGRAARALLHKLVVRDLADDERAGAGTGRLGVAFEAEVEVALNEQL